MMRVFGVLSIAALVAGCEGGGSPTLQAKEGQSALEVARSITQTRGVAISLARICPTGKYALREPSLVRALQKDLANLERQGYSKAQMETAFAKTRQPREQKAIIRTTITYMEALGAKRGQPASACVVADNEVKRASPVGRLLKRV